MELIPVEVAPTNLDPTKLAPSPKNPSCAPVWSAIHCDQAII